jgi:hypothetical protein
VQIYDYFFNKQIFVFFFLLNRKTVFVAQYIGNCYICGLINKVLWKKCVPGKSGLLYGVLFGVIMVLEFVVMYIIGMRSLVGTSAGVIVNIANYLVYLIHLFRMHQLQKNLNNGFISFGESLKVGVSILFIAGLVYGLFNIGFNFIYPDFINEMASITKEC